VLLSDRRLKFADELIMHWLDIRGDALVPLEEDIVPNALQHCFDRVGIADLSQPAQVIFEVAGAEVSRRFGRNIARLNWVDLVPPAVAEVGVRAREKILGVPCGFYHEIVARRGRGRKVAAESLVLPLRRADAVKPDALIGITREDRDGVITPAGWLDPSAQIEHYACEYVDIGAGVSMKG
jgi:hypothetical protein